MLSPTAAIIGPGLGEFGGPDHRMGASVAAPYGLVVGHVAPEPPSVCAIRPDPADGDTITVDTSLLGLLQLNVTPPSWSAATAIWCAPEPRLPHRRAGQSTPARVSSSRPGSGHGSALN